MATTGPISKESIDYLFSSTLREPELLRRLREETSKMEEAPCQVGPVQGQFMALLVKALGVKRALEVGVFTGASSLWVANALPEDGKLVACDVNEEWTATARRYWEEAGVARKIELHLAPAEQTLDRLIAEGEGGSFDFAFIDADKVSYDIYYERCLALVRRGGLVALDNALRHGRVHDPEADDPETEAVRTLNQKLLQDDRIQGSLVPIGDGLYLALKL